MISILSLFERNACSTSLSMKEMELFAIVNWIFLCVRSFEIFYMPFKYGLTLLRHSSTDSDLFL